MSTASASSGWLSLIARSAVASRESERVGLAGRSPWSVTSESYTTVSIGQFEDGGKSSSCYNVVRMRLLMVGSEAVPFAKTGGLADVMGALPRALVRLGHEVDVVMPRYRGITAGTPDRTLKVALGGLVADATCHVASHQGVRTIFIDHPGYFDRDYLYGAPGHDYLDNPERFAFLCQAALDWAVESGSTHDVVHAHDWQAGLVPVLLARMLASRAVLRRLPTVFPIHNLA